MIIGLGSDITDIRRIEQALKRFGERFERRVFTEAECAKARSRTHPAATYAKRFAAKEACIKALGAPSGLSWQNMEIVNLESGQPALRLHNAAQERLRSLAPPPLRPVIYVSLSDEYPYALAQVLIEAI